MSILKNEIKEAVNALKNHGVVCFPTETVMGLGVVYNDYDAYNYLNKIKLRNEDKPYTMMLFDTNDIKKYAYVSSKNQKLIDALLPGSITILLPSKDNVPSYVTHSTNIIGIRIPTNIEAIELLKEIKVPLLVPSANKADCKPSFSSSEAKEIFKDEVQAYISGSSKGEKPSTIVSLINDEPLIIREGPISKDEILKYYK